MAATQTFSAYWTGGLGVDEPIYFFFSLGKKFQDFFFFTSCSPIPPDEMGFQADTAVC